MSNIENFSIENPEEDSRDEEYYTMNFEESSKKYINTLRSFSIDHEVIVWVEDKILSLDRRIHKFDNTTLAAYIILGYRSLEKKTTIENILEKTGTMKKRKKVLDLISGDSTENTPIHEVGIGIPVIICSPVDFISQIVKKFYEMKAMKMDEGMKILSKNIKKFTCIMFNSINILSNYEPKSLACAFVYFYLNEIIDINHSAHSNGVAIKKTHFKTLSLSDERKSDINPKDFDCCFEIIQKYYDGFMEVCDRKEFKELVTY